MCIVPPCNRLWTLQCEVFTVFHCMHVSSTFSFCGLHLKSKVTQSSKYQLKQSTAKIAAILLWNHDKSGWRVPRNDWPQGKSPQLKGPLQHFGLIEDPPLVVKRGRRGVPSGTFGTLIVRFDGLRPVLWSWPTQALLSCHQQGRALVTRGIPRTSENVEMFTW